MKRRMSLAWVLVALALGTVPLAAEEAPLSSGFTHSLTGRSVQEIYVAGNGVIYAGANVGEGVYRSTNQGQSWSGYGQEMGTKDVMALTQWGDQLLAGVWGGDSIYRRGPGDDHWSSMRDGMDGDHRYARDLACTQGAAPIAYADMGEAVYRLAFGAARWQQLPNTNLPALAEGAPPPNAAPAPMGRAPLSKDALAADAPSFLCLALDSSGRLYAGLANAGVYAYNPAQSRWDEIGDLNRSCYALAFDGAGALWAGAAGGVYRWDGAAWVASPGGPTGDATALKANTSGDCLYAGLRDGSVWRLARASGVWQSLGSVGDRVWALGFCQAGAAERLLVGAKDGGLYYTEAACPPPAAPTPSRTPTRAHTPTPTATPLCALHVDDFEDTNPINDLLAASTWAALGGAGCSVNANPYNGYELNLEYNLAAGCTARYATGLHRDVSGYRSLTLEIKGADTSQIADLWVGLSDGAVTTCLKIGDFASWPITTAWQGVSFPLAAFDGALDLAAIEAIAIEARAGQAARAGSVQLDRLRFECSQVPLILDRFDDRANPHALGQNPTLLTNGGATLSARYIGVNTWDASAGAYELTYNVPVGAWAVCEFPFAPIDLTLYRSLRLMVRGAPGAKVNVWLHDNVGGRQAVNLEDYAEIAPEWVRVSIPLSDFRPNVNLRAVIAVKFAFEWEPEPMQGVVALDNLWFSVDPLLLDPYCDADSSNSLNGRAGPFYPDAGVCVPTMVARMEGGALRLDYRVPSAGGCYAGYTSNAPMNAEPYRSLRLRVRGTSNAASASTALEVRDPGVWFDKAKLSDYLPYGIYEGEWQQVEIPFAFFPSVERWDHAERLVIAFEQGKGASQGTLWVDEVSLSSACAPLWVQNWNDGDLRNAFHLDDSVFYGGGGGIVQANVGGALQLTYDAPPGGWACWRTELRGVDLGEYGQIRFRMKGNITGSAPKLFLQDIHGRKGFVSLARYYGAFPADWRDVTVSLDDLGWGLDLGELAEMHIGVNDPGSGVIYLDDLRYECRNARTWCPPVAVMWVKAPH